MTCRGWTRSGHRRWELVGERSHFHQRRGARASRTQRNSTEITKKWWLVSLGSILHLGLPGYSASTYGDLGGRWIPLPGKPYCDTLITVNCEVPLGLPFIYIDTYLIGWSFWSLGQAKRSVHGSVIAVTAKLVGSGLGMLLVKRINSFEARSNPCGIPACMLRRAASTLTFLTNVVSVKLEPLKAIIFGLIPVHSKPTYSKRSPLYHTPNAWTKLDNLERTFIGLKLEEKARCFRRLVSIKTFTYFHMLWKRRWCSMALGICTNMSIELGGNFFRAVLTIPSSVSERLCPFLLPPGR